MSSNNDVYQHRVVSIGSLLLSAYGNVQLLFNYGKLSGEISTTPFSNFLIFMIVYWAVYYLVQLVYLNRVVSVNVDSSETNALAITHNLISFNTFTFIWSLLFRFRWYVVSEIVVIIELFVILNNYLNYKIYAFKPLKNFLLINLTNGSLPLSWIFFVLFWNGALMVHSTGFVARVLANIFIWDFLIIGVVFLTLFNDYTVGFSLSYLVLGMALNQLFTKFVALQWIFGFIISGLLLVISVGTILLKPKLKDQIVVQEESVGSATAPLLGGN
ncbi:hypothetical protein PSN45_001683 [Yamadazyma tenuis]|uniref:DUF1774-domain-containing protein n=1 Tax=Candida tenuis (strain ATCC 10573 / BCRC 21748 / CBS 615 / JCM 9827 / NBRC 10315 / NRRL Y-1498 / VKM Y-70) TaxID=590646 RepID=G3BEI9_CANTC|nr:DUF1774-domain-containing protein [Yamadazyma tenuis ATCC 10573]EGV60554.1 DUF1774-domain-containing protein [Yamadazyma tenuis ATCC 10573]WEJ94203.1 hypothetical protein PSN45_001683 [Yamadazyma tenuis]